MSNTPEPTLFFFFFVVLCLTPSPFFRQRQEKFPLLQEGTKIETKIFEINLVLETETGSLPIDRYLLERSRLRSIEPSAASPTTHTT